MISLMRWFAIFFFLLLAQLTLSRGTSLTLIKTPGGLPMCALNPPALSMLISDILGIPDGVPDVMRCGYQCSSLGDRACAAGFNYDGNGHCQFYVVPPVNCSTGIKSCEYYEVRRKTTFFDCGSKLLKRIVY